MSVRFIAVVLFVSFIATAVAGAEPPPSGRVLFASFCTSCHALGEGAGPAVDLAGPKVARRSDEDLMETIRGGIRERGMPRFGGALSSQELVALIGYLRELQGRPAITRAVEALPERDERYERGRQLFHGRARCGSCHAHDDVGGLQGSDLTDVGGRLPLPLLRRSLRRPSAQITPGYEAYLLVTKDGRSVRGRARKNTDDSIQILDETGELWTTYRKQELRSIARDDRSLMPEGLLTPLTAVERADLFYFLSRSE